MTSPGELPAAARAAERLGLFGGSFDPVHEGHLHVARTAREARALDHVLFVPAARPPHKPGRRLAPGPDRVAMLELAFGGSGEPCSVWGVELARPGRSFTIDTVRELIGLRPGRPRPWLVLGSDNLPGLPSWREVEELLRLAPPIVVQRGGFGPELVDGLELSAEARAALARGFVGAAPDPSSSTAARRALGGAEAADEVPAAVAEYARARGLYGEGRGAGGSAGGDGA